MADEFQVNITGIPEVLRKLNASRRPEVIKRSLYQGGLMIAGWSKQNRLTGPRPAFLGVVSGRLRSSISASKTEESGGVYTTKIGTNVKYGKAHELGFSGKVFVRSFVRRTKRGTQLVKAHNRTMNIKARPFLRPAIENEGNREEVLRILIENIREELKK